MNTKRVLISASIVGIVCLCTLIFGLIVPIFLSSGNEFLIFIGIALALFIVFSVIVEFVIKVMEYFNE